MAAKLLHGPLVLPCIAIVEHLYSETLGKCTPLVGTAQTCPLLQETSAFECGRYRQRCCNERHG
jgi:hypothetical protein